MYDRGAEGSQHHSGTDHEAAHHHHRSAAIAIHKYAAQGSWTEGRRMETPQCPLPLRVCCPAASFHSPPAYMAASMTEETQAIWL